MEALLIGTLVVGITCFTVILTMTGFVMIIKRLT